MASAVIAARAGLGELTDAVVRRPDVRALMRKVRVVTNEDYDTEALGASVWDQVRVQLVSGTVLESEKVWRARGHASRPLSSAELFEKFRGCLEAGGSSLDPKHLFDRLQRLEEVASARELVAP